MTRRHYLTKEVEVDMTDEVEEAAEELARDLVAKGKGSELGIGTLDLDAAIVGTLRQARRGATARGVLDMLLGLIGSDHLRREVVAALTAKGDAPA